MSIQVGDIVVTRRGDLGLLVRLRPDLKFGASVQFVNNGPLRHYVPSSLRRATLGEIEVSPLAGVGCNQATEDTR